MIRSILQHPNKLLRKRSREILSQEGLVELVTDATDTMLALDSSGLSLVILGIPLRAILLNCLGGRTVTLVNPVIVKGLGQVIADETCVCLPGRSVKVMRHEYVEVRHDRTYGQEKFEVTDVQLAVAIQHEVDHLNGVLTLDRVHSDRPRTFH